MLNTTSIVPESNVLEPQNHIHTTQPVELSHEQEIRVNSATEDLSHLIASTRHVPITEDLYKSYTDMKNLMGGIPSTQKILRALQIIRNKEKVLPFLNEDQKKMLIEINTYYIPLFLPIIAMEDNGRFKQELVLDVLSLEGITPEQMRQLEEIQNELTEFSMGHPEYGIEQSKLDWKRFVE